MKELERLSNYLQSLGDKWYETKEWEKLSEGEKHLVRIYNGIQREKNNEYSPYEILTDKLFIENIFWENELEELYNSMKKMDIKEFIFANESTACLRTLNFFINKGCKITGNEVYKIEELCGKAQKKHIEGLIITLS